MKGGDCRRTLHFGYGHENLPGNACLHTEHEKIGREPRSAVHARIVVEHDFTEYYIPFFHSFLIQYLLKPSLNCLIQADECSSACRLVRGGEQLINAPDSAQVFLCCRL